MFLCLDVSMFFVFMFCMCARRGGKEACLKDYSDRAKDRCLVPSIVWKVALIHHKGDLWEVLSID